MHRTMVFYPYARNKSPTVSAQRKNRHNREQKWSEGDIYYDARSCILLVSVRARTRVCDGAAQWTVKELGTASATSQRDYPQRRTHLDCEEVRHVHR